MSETVPAYDLDYFQYQAPTRPTELRPLSEQIDSAIWQSRKGLIGKEGRADSAYEMAFDARVYQAIWPFLRFSDSFEYQSALQKLDSYTHDQLTAHIGERLFVLRSNFEYEIKDGKFWFGNRPFVEWISDGQKHREQMGSRDVEREKAEVLSASKIEEVLADPSTSVGTKMVHISPPGGSYLKHFIDINEVVERDGKRFLKATRFSSGLDLSDYPEKIRQLNSTHPAYLKLDDLTFISNPVPVTSETMQTIEDIHRLFHKDHEYMDPEDFQEVVALTRGARQAYIDQLRFDPYDYEELSKRFKTIFNRADEIKENIDRRKRGEEYEIYWDDDISQDEIDRLGSQEIREVKTACGNSGGPEDLKEVLMRDENGSIFFDCPKCHQKNIRPFNKLLANCQFCGTDKVACKDDKKAA